MTEETRMALLLMGELVAALRANDPDLFKRWLCGGIEDLGEPAVTELLLDWLAPLLTKEDKDRLVGWHLGRVRALILVLWMQEASIHTILFKEIRGF